jgi:hypothetical protein
VGAGVLLAAVLLLLTSCQQAPAPQPAAKAASPAEQLMREGHDLMARGDYANATERYRQAADLEPAAIPPRFALGTAYSFQEKRAEAIVQFRWVLASAAAASAEYQDAHRWLARVGALPAPAAVADGDRRNVAATPDPSRAGRLVGRTEWGDLNPKSQLVTGNLSLIGDEPVTHDVKRTRAFRLGDGYEFKDVPAGRYRIVAVIDETTVWDEKVTVEVGKDTSVTLRQSTSPVPANRFAPPPATAGAGVSPSR